MHVVLSVSLYSFKASWRRFRRKRFPCTRRPWRYNIYSSNHSLKRNWFDDKPYTAISGRLKIEITPHVFLSLVKLYSFCGFCFCFSQSKKNYELRCKEANEAEQGAEKKNPDKVQYLNDLPYYKSKANMWIWIQTFKVFHLDFCLCTQLHYKNDYHFSSVY